MKCRLLTSTKGTRPERIHSLKKHQIHLGLLKKNAQAMVNRSLKKYQVQAIEKRPLQKQEKKLKRPYSLKKHQYHLNLLKQMTQARKKKKGCPKTKMGKKYLLCWG